MSKKTGIIGIIVFLVIGFASVSTVLSIVGRTQIKENPKDFDVYFSKALLNGVEHNELISSNGKNIDFGINELKTLNEEVVLDYEITNSSSQYDADINLLFDNLNNLSEYLEVTREDNYNGSITANGKGTGKIKIKLIKPVTEDSDVDLNFNLGVNAEEKEIDDLHPDYTPDNPKNNDYSISGTVTDKTGEPIKDKIVVISTPDGLLYTKTDLEGNFYQDNLPEGTLDIYIIEDKTMEEVKNMTLDEIKEAATGHINVTTSTKGDQKGDNINISDISSDKTSDMTIVEIIIGDNSIKKEPNENNEIIFNVDTNDTVIEIPGLGSQELLPGENRFELELENGETITIIVNNDRPTPPEITGGSSTYVNTKPVEISVKNSGSALSDVKHYEYIISTNEIIDFNNVVPTGTTSGSISIDTDGTKYVYYRTVSKNETLSSWSKVEIVKIDTTSPTLTITETTSSSNNIDIKFNAFDADSGIKKITCKYGEDYKLDGTLENGVCHLSDLAENTIYDYQICATDNVDNASTCKVGTVGTKVINNPKITFEGVESAAGGYYLGQTAKVVFNQENITTPTYYIKSTRKGVANLNVIGTCGTGAYPNTECTSTTTTNIEANTWYQVTGNIDIAYTESYDEFSQIIAVTYDGVNYSGLSTGTIGKIAYRAIDLEYSNALAPNVTNVQEAIDDLYSKLR